MNHHDVGSVWEWSIERPHFASLREDRSTEVLIVGGGMAGVLCAYRLQNAGVHCLLVEAAEIGGGITRNTTAKITLGHGLIYNKMTKRFGEETARLYVEAQTMAMKEYKMLCTAIDWRL